MSEYPWNEKSNTFIWLSSLYNPFKGLIVCVLFLIWKKHSNILSIQKIWRKSPIYFENVVKDILPLNFTKFQPLECWQMKTAFKTKLQCFFLECKFSAWTISWMILKRLQHDIPVYSSHACPKYWAF